MDADAALLPSARWALYREAVVDIRFGNDRIIRVAPARSGGVEGCFPEPYGRTIHVITPHNPHGRAMPARDNDRALRALLAEIGRRSLRWWPAIGGDAHGRHTEASAAVTGLSDAEARALGRRFGQDAVFAWDPASWRLLPCAGGPATSCGWRATARGVSRCPRPGNQAG